MVDVPCVLLVSNSHDFATDYVVAELRARGVRYLRLDTDLMAEDAVTLDPAAPTLEASTPQGRFCLTSQQVSGILFRAPTHLSESSGARYDARQQLARHQWAAFARALTVFENASWVNHPVATFRAESKPFQLRVATKLGWNVLPTRVSNSVPPLDWPPHTSGLAIKALDTFFSRVDTDDLFFYTRRVERAELADSTLRAMPVILQQYADRKLDLRVTVVGECCMAAAILRDGAAIEGDWRLQKSDVEYRVHELPPEIERRCVATARALGLIFAAVDLVVVNGIYHFLEVNPTGEWAWLTQTLGFPIPALIADELCRPVGPGRQD